jgi:aminopeptidase N
MKHGTPAPRGHRGPASPGRPGHNGRVLSVTEGEARERAELLTDIGYEVFLDLAATPARSRTRVRFRCRRPGADTFAQLGLAAAGEVRLNGQPLPPPDGGRVRLAGLAAENVLVADGVIADVGGMDPGLIRFTDPADGATYVLADGFPDQAARLFCCFDQPSLPCALTLSVRVPPGWHPLGNGQAHDGGGGVWRFGTVTGMRPHLFTVCAGPYQQVWAGSGGHGVAVRAWRRAALPQRDGVLGRFAETAVRALRHYERALGTPCPYPGYDIVFVPELTGLAGSVPGLMCVSETLLARMADPDDEFVAAVCAHEVAHLWFGSHVTMRWWDDLWLDEALATYLSAEFTGGWAGFGFREKARAYRADELPGRLPVSSPVASSAQALSRFSALTYNKGAAVIRQLGAVIGEDALRAGMRDYLARFGGDCGTSEDLVACWSRASGRDLAGWAEAWLRSEGAPALRAALAAGPGPLAGPGASLVVTQDPPHPQLVRIGLYDRARAGRGLRRRQLVQVELAGERIAVPITLDPGEAVPDLVVANDGDLGYARITFDERSWQALAAAALEMDDPVTEAVCWNAAWQLVTGARLPAASFADLVIRRLADGQAGLPAPGAEVLLERAVSCADVYAPADHRAGLREQIADSTLAAAARARPGSPVQRTLAAAFAASAHRGDQLDLLTAWLDGNQAPGGLAVDAELRARALFTLSARGRARQADVDALPELDHANGARYRATCLAMRPDPHDREEAWRAVISGTVTGRLAEATAQGVWVAGQEQLMAGYRSRYFGEALHALAGMSSWAQQRLGRLLFPSTLCDAATVEAAQAAPASRTLPEDLRNAVAEQTAIIHEVIASRGC